MTTLFILFFQISVFAAENGAAGAHGDDHIPFATIGWQTLNLGILLIVIFFAVRKSIVAFFQSRAANYYEQAQKTAEATRAAEQALSDIKSRIQNLQESEHESVESAKIEAAALKNRIIEEARAQAEKIKTDTQLVVAAEISSAKSEIRREIINASLELAKGTIKGSADTISKKSEKTFLDDISKTKNQVTL